MGFHHIRIMRKWARYAPDAFWGDRLNVRFHLCAVLRKLHGKKLLDLGCGPGIILSEVPDDNEKFGIDLKPAFLETAKRLNPGGTFLERDINKLLPFPDLFFDVVIAASIVEPGIAGPSFLPEASRILKENGLFLLTTPNREHSAFMNHPSKFTMAEAQQVLQSHFSGKLYGYNHLGFLPSFTRRLLYPLPFIGTLLAWLMFRSPPAKGTAFFFQGRLPPRGAEPA